MLVLNSQRFIAAARDCGKASSDSGSSTESGDDERDSTLMTFIIPQKERIEYKPLVRFLVSLALHNELQPSVLKFDRLCASDRGLLTSRHNSRLAIWQKQRCAQIVRSSSTRCFMTAPVEKLSFANHQSGTERVRHKHRSSRWQAQTGFRAAL